MPPLADWYLLHGIANNHFQVKDLGKQISHLLKQAQTSEELDVDVDVDVVDDVDVVNVPDRLLTFSNVDELQQRNAELLSLVNEMSAERESAEIHKVWAWSSLVEVVRWLRLRFPIQQ